MNGRRSIDDVHCRCNTWSLNDDLGSSPVAHRSCCRRVGGRKGSGWAAPSTCRSCRPNSVTDQFTQWAAAARPSATSPARQQLGRSAVPIQPVDAGFHRLLIFPQSAKNWRKVTRKALGVVLSHRHRVRIGADDDLEATILLDLNLVAKQGSRNAPPQGVSPRSTTVTPKYFDEPRLPETR